MPDSITPHGSDKLLPLFIADDSARKAAIKDAEKLPSVTVSSATAANAVMLGAGYFTPLSGFMDAANALSVGASMTLQSGLFWPTPVMNLLEAEPPVGVGERLALRDPNVDGNPVLAIQTIDSIEQLGDQQLTTLAQQVYGTSDRKHPGVAAFLSQGNTVVAGSIEVLNYSYFSSDFPDTFRTAAEIRQDIEKRGWQRVVAFQTRNPMHRAHEELCHMAMDRLNADGLVVHMLLGKLKAGDIPADVRDAAIRKMIKLSHDYRLRFRYALCRTTRSTPARSIQAKHGCYTFYYRS